MRVQTHIELTEAYKLINGGLDPDNLKERSILLNEYNYSVIVEGEWMELENLEKWIIQNIDEVQLMKYGMVKRTMILDLLSIFLEIK